MKWTDSDNLNGREIRIVGGQYDGLRVVVNRKSGAIRYPDVFDLSEYRYEEETSTFVHYGEDPRGTTTTL